MQAASYERIVLDRYCFVGFHCCLAWCGLEIIGLNDGRTAVIATELPDNPGTNVTKAMKLLAATVCLEFGIDPNALVWIEHYGFPSVMSPTEPRGFDQVQFTFTSTEIGSCISDVQRRPMKDADWLALGIPPRLLVRY